MNIIHAHSTMPAASLSDAAPLALLTINEVARELRCSRAHLYNVLSGKVESLPPLPVFHIGRRTYIRRAQLQAWVSSLEDREREGRYASGYFGVRDDHQESIAGV
jgi:AraC-like DNA-binding protein